MLIFKNKNIKKYKIKNSPIPALSNDIATNKQTSNKTPRISKSTIHAQNLGTIPAGIKVSVVPSGV